MKLNQVLVDKKNAQFNRNKVVQNAPTRGAGAHEDKKGKHAKRAKQKAKFRKQLKNMDF